MPYKNKAAKLKAQRERRLKPLEAPNEAPAKMKSRNEAPKQQMKSLDEAPEVPGLDNISNIFKTRQGLDKLRAIIDSFEDSNHPEYMKEVRLGTFGPTLDYIKRLYV